MCSILTTFYPAFVSYSFCFVLTASQRLVVVIVASEEATTSAVVLIIVVVVVVIRLLSTFARFARRDRKQESRWRDHARDAVGGAIPHRASPLVSFLRSVSRQSNPKLLARVHASFAGFLRNRRLGYVSFRSSCAALSCAVRDQRTGHLFLRMAFSFAGNRRCSNGSHSPPHRFARFPLL